jgi:ribonuclease HII
MQILRVSPRDAIRRACSARRYRFRHYPMTGMSAVRETACSRADDVYIHSKLRAFMFTSKVRIRMRKSIVVGGKSPQVVALASTLATVARNSNGFSFFC